MKIEFEGVAREFDWKSVTVKQGIAIYLAHHITIAEYLDGLTKSDPRALQSAYWLMLQQAGTVKPIADCDFDAIAFAEAILKGINDEPDDDPEPEAAPPVPTSPPPGDPAWSGPGYPTATTPPQLVQPQQIAPPTGYSPSP